MGVHGFRLHGHNADLADPKKVSDIESDEASPGTVTMDSFLALTLQVQQPQNNFAPTVNYALSSFISYYACRRNLQVLNHII